MKPEDKMNPKLIEAAEKIKDVLGILGVYDKMDSRLDIHLKDTPMRIVTAWKEFTENMNNDIGVLTSFDEEIVDGMPIVRSIRYSSLCMHHFFPFMGIAHVAYLPNDSLLGLSKIPRTVKFIAKKPTLQEFLTRDIADALFNAAKPKFLMVITQAVHSCCSSRGIESDSDMVFSTIRTDNSLEASEVNSLKTEVLSLIKMKF